MGFQGEDNARRFENALGRSVTRWKTMVMSPGGGRVRSEVSFENGQYTLAIIWPAQPAEIQTRLKDICRELEAAQPHQGWGCFMSSRDGQPVLAIEGNHLDPMIDGYNRFVTMVIGGRDSNIPLDQVTIQSPLHVRDVV